MMRTAELAALVGGTCEGPGDRQITGVASLVEAGPGDISFFHNSRYASRLATTKAGAVLVPPDQGGRPDGACWIRVANPSAAFGEVVARFAPPRPTVTWGVHSRAVVEEGASFDAAKVSIGPGAVVSRGVSVGDGSVVGANVFLGEGVRVGRDCRLHAGVSVREHCLIGNRVIIHSNAVIGSDGFGFEMVDGHHQKIEQVGIVQIDDDVEIGAGSTIDRARFGRTWIGEGTKIDNLVMVGHNVVIGKHCILVAQCGVAGSTVLGDHVVLAAQSGVTGHLRLGDGVVLMARGGALKDLEQPGYYMGFPAGPAAEVRREMVMARQVPSILKRLKRLEEPPAPGT